jgi:serine/threonine protein kinase
MSPCRQPGCAGAYAADGYCDECGHKAPAPDSPSARSGTPARRSTRLSSTGELGIGGANDPTRAVGRGRLGASLVAVPPVPLRDPADALMAVALVPGSQRFCFVQHPDPKTGQMTGYTVMEYVGGQSLKELARASTGPDGRRAPLPLPQVLAYGLEVLPALGYLHAQGLLFCDFKPDNVIQAEEQIKLIDLGAVRRIDDDDSVIYGTPGYQAPELATAGASIGSDLYTVGRTLAVLSFDFGGFSTKYADRLPDPSEVELLAREESYYRFLRRATHPDVRQRFRSAAEMADQLLGVLREVLAAADGVPRPGVSSLFTQERAAC